MLRIGYRFLFTVFLTIVIAVFFIDVYVSFFARNRIYGDRDKIPINKCGLVLGTSKFRVDGGINPYFSKRLDAAMKLYFARKIEYIIVSGDNGERYYNEPLQMKKYLIERGVPGKKIFMDFAGFRTLDSVVRAKHIFGQKALTIISQRFHLERAIYIGSKNGMDVLGFAADEVDEPGHVRVRLREVFARVKACLDIHVLRKKPRFLGEKILID